MPLKLPSLRAIGTAFIYKRLISFPHPIADQFLTNGLTRDRAIDPKTTNRPSQIKTDQDYYSKDQ
jgi:hypothetical protein